MAEFFEDDVIGQVRELWGAWMLLDGTHQRADLYRCNFQDEVCHECGQDVEDAFADGLGVVVDGCEWDECYCLDCWSEWFSDAPEFIPLFQTLPNPMACLTCDYCNEAIAYGHEDYAERTWFADDEDGYTACHECWSDWANQWSQDNDTDEDTSSYDDGAYDGAWCAWCETEVAGVIPYVTNPFGDAYCMACWYWEDEGTHEPPAKVARARHDEDAAGKARNDRDKAKLRARHKDHCAYHLFHAHHRKHQGCTFAAAGQNRCARGSHGIPDDFEDTQGELETLSRA